MLRAAVLLLTALMAFSPLFDQKIPHFPCVKIRNLFGVGGALCELPFVRDKG